MPNPPKRLIDGDTHLRGGSNSSSPLNLVPGYYDKSVNMLNRGGVLQTRPGYRWVATLPDGLLQGFTVFRPFQGVPQFIVVIEGRAYRSYFPFETFDLVDGIFFSPTAPRVYFCRTVRSVTYNEDGSLSFITPTVTLLIQDGTNAPAFYDGTKFEHLHGSGTTPIGSVMAWSGDRLWVANGSRIYVSDIANPLTFVEQTYNLLGGQQSFTVPADVTGMAETTGTTNPQLMVFTQAQTFLFQSNVRDRSQWPTLPNFQTKVFDVGAVSQRSIVAMHGMLHWVSSFGLVSLNASALAFVSSELGFEDNEMAWSKARMNGYMASIAGCSFENYLIMSVPHESYYNPHTWVLDFTVADTLNSRSPKAWASVWAGTRPVEWVSTELFGVPRIFHVSVEEDSPGQLKNRLWEAFTSERRDEFVDIDWSFETRCYNAGSVGQKEARFAELALSDLQGAVDLSVKWAGGNKGRWHEIANFRVWSNEGIIFADQLMPNPIFGLKKQTRLFRTEDIRNVPVTKPDGCDVESTRLEAQDSSFQLCVSGNGPCAVNILRFFLDDVTEDNYAACTESETPGHYVRADGAGSRDLAELAAYCPSCACYTGMATVTGSYNGYEITVVKQGQSCISQAAADKLAQQRAWAEVNIYLQREAPPFRSDGSKPPVHPPAPVHDWRLDFSVDTNSLYVPLAF